MEQSGCIMAGLGIDFMNNLILSCFLFIAIGLNAAIVQNSFTTNNPVPPSAIAALGGLTNGMVSEVLLFTNNVAMLPGFGYTNWPASTTAGIQEIMNLYAMPAIYNPVGGVNIHLGSSASSNKPAYYTITTCIKATNYFTLQGNGLGATVIEYKGSSIGTTNDSIPAALMFYTPPLVSGGASNALNYFEMHDLALASDIDCPAAMIVTYANAFNISRCQFGSTNMLYQTNFVTSPAYVGSSSTAPRGLIGVYIQGTGNNQDAFYNCFFQDLADGIFADGADWGIVQDCHFGSISIMPGTLFTNTWNTNVQFHVGAAIGMSSVGLGWTLRQIHALNCNTLFYCPNSANISCYDMEAESVNYYSLGSLPMTYSKILPNATVGTWSTVNTLYQATGTTSSKLGNGYLIGMDDADDFQFTVRDDTGRDLLKLPNKFEETETGLGGFISPYMTYDIHGVFSFNGGGITNLNPNALSKSTANIPTNTAATIVLTNDLVAGAWNLQPNARGSIIISAWATATLTIPTNGAMQYSNAVTGKIMTAAIFSIPAGVLAADTQTNELSIPDISPNSMFRLSGGTPVPNTTIWTTSK